jgi:hypothetical protein
MKTELDTTIRDYKKYLDGILVLAKPLPTDQKDQLNTILKSQLTLLVALKISSGLGETIFDFNRRV